MVENHTGVLRGDASLYQQLKSQIVQEKKKVAFYHTCRFPINLRLS